MNPHSTPSGHRTVTLRGPESAQPSASRTVSDAPCSIAGQAVADVPQLASATTDIETHTDRNMRAACHALTTS